MTFNSNVPNTNESPGLFPAQANTNFGRLKGIISGDHVFNDSTQPDDGAHNRMSMVNQANPSRPFPAGVNAIHFTKLAGSQTQAYLDNGDTIQRVTPIAAMVNFDGTGAIGVQTIRSQYNVASVTKTGVGSYIITFTAPLPDNNYCISVTGMRDSASGSASIANGQVKGSPTYNVSTTSVVVSFNDTSSSAVSVLMGSVIVYSFT